MHYKKYKKFLHFVIALIYYNVIIAMQAQKTCIAL